MSERDLILLILAPATVGLVVMALRRTTPPIYWAGLVGVITLTLLTLLGQRLQTAGSIETVPVTLAIVLFVVPTVAAFGVGRSVAPSRGGAYVFAVTCSAYVLALGIAATISFIIRVIAF